MQEFFNYAVSPLNDKGEFLLTINDEQAIIDEENLKYLDSYTPEELYKSLKGNHG